LLPPTETPALTPPTETPRPAALAGKHKATTTAPPVKVLVKFRKKTILTLPMLVTWAQAE
ncbi:MAG: hypothetical protein ABJB10_19560, partial [Mesorhizobium sp.]